MGSRGCEDNNSSGDSAGTLLRYYTLLDVLQYVAYLLLQVTP